MSENFNPEINSLGIENQSPQVSNKKNNRATTQQGRSASSMQFHPNTPDGDRKIITNYTDSVLWNQSSSTWLHSSPIHSFPKAQRFQFKGSSLQMDLINLPSTLGKRTTNLGYSQKQFIPESQLNNAKNIPAPNFYHIQDFVELDERKKKGKSFGLSYAFYQRVYTPEMKHYPNPMFFKSNPGPGMYNVSEEPGKNKLKYSLYSKGITFSQMQKTENPAANYYSPKRVLTEQSRFRKITFGYGNKLDLAKASNDYPGPGTYKLPSVFDKCKKKKKIQVEP